MAKFQTCEPPGFEAVSKASCAPKGHTVSQPGVSNPGFPFRSGARSWPLAFRDTTEDLEEQQKVPWWWRKVPWVWHIMKSTQVRLGPREKSICPTERGPGCNSSVLKRFRADSRKTHYLLISVARLTLA